MQSKRSQGNFSLFSNLKGSDTFSYSHLLPKKLRHMISKVCHFYMLMRRAIKSFLKGVCGNHRAVYLCEGPPVHVGAADVNVFLVYNPELGVKDAWGEREHVDSPNIGPWKRRSPLRQWRPQCKGKKAAETYLIKYSNTHNYNCTINISASMLKSPQPACEMHNRNSDCWLMESGRRSSTLQTVIEIQVETWLELQSRLILIISYKPTRI